MLGATGYLGSEFLTLLAQAFPGYPVVALLREPTPQRIAALSAIHPNVTTVEGSLDSADVIQRQAAEADIVINAASSDHSPSVKAILQGLEKNSLARPGQPPLYIHVSGCGIVSDDARGEPVDHVQEWSDIGLDLNQCPPTNMHLESDIPITTAGTRTDVPIRTIILYPGQIYGVGEGIQKTTLWLRIFLDMTKKVGHAGTWGPGANSMNNIHVRDAAEGMLVVLKAALEGKADEGAEGHYFLTTMERKVSYREWTQVLGDILYAKGIIKEAGSRPMPSEVVEPLGHYGWSLLGGNQFTKPERLARLGWVPKHSAELSLLDSFPAAIDVALQEGS
ncbi:NAD(P)-binding protein [Dentipellis sp. KUC8613]|nr:NAD(P)-binding protein [Dentipellis sp. KUC8613]